LLTDEQERELLIGHQADIILQAICRGSARSTVDGRCGRCDAYIIVHPKHGIIERLQKEIFPGCSVADWTPAHRPPSGNVAKALDYVFHWFVAFPDQELPFTKVYKALGMSASNFHKLRRHDDFVFAITEEGIGTDRRYARAFRRVTDEPPSTWDYLYYFPSQDDAEDAAAV